jgi:hypothetical protein
MCDLDHLSFATFGGIPAVICNDVPPHSDGVVIPTPDQLAEFLGTTR